MANKKFSWSSLVTTSLLVGFVGFGLGFNWPRIETFYEQRLGSQQEGLPADLDFSGVEAVYDALRQNYAGELDVNKLLDGAKEGLVHAAGDPHTVYLPEQAAQEFKESLEGTFSGVGIEIATKNDRLTVVAPLADTPAEAAGIQAGDIIAEINGESTEDISVEEAVTKIRGEAGTEVTLTVVSGNDAPREVAITRATIEVPSVRSELKPGNVGYIEITRFSDDTVEAFKQAATELKTQGADKIVLDLRNNPGGLLDGAVNIADEFLASGEEIIQQRRDGEVIDTEYATPGGVLVGVPTVVLINGGSASASEIVAGALKDNNVATLVGEQSFGKGSVQEIINLDGHAVLKVTVALWYTPDGRNITKEGIAPDQQVELSDDDFNNNRDPQLNQALEIAGR